VPVTSGPDSVRLEGSAGTPVEWAVTMLRLPDEARLSSRLERGEVDPALIEAIASRIAEFHARAVRGPHVARLDGRDRGTRRARQFCTITGASGHYDQQGRIGPAAVLAEQALNELRLFIECRGNQAVPSDTHGGLHLDQWPNCLPLLMPRRSVVHRCGFSSTGFCCFDLD
jgi:aminoglycoside phosphotransferase family enzyme